MSISARAKCWVGSHSGDWSYPGQQCETIRVCNSCRKREQETHHTWAQFAYAAAEECEQIRRCERCGATEARTIHEWGPWCYQDNEVNSPQFHRCERCHQTERTNYTMR